MKNSDWNPEIGDVVQFRTPKKDERASDRTLIERDIGTPKAFGIYAIIGNVQYDEGNPLISLEYFTFKDQMTLMKSSWFRKESFNFICHFKDIFDIVAGTYKYPDEPNFRVDEED